MPTHSMPLTSRGLGPLASAHVQLGVVDAERLDLDDHVAGLGLRLRQFLVDEAVESAELLENDGAHGLAARLFTHDGGRRRKRRCRRYRLGFVSMSFHGHSSLVM